MSEETILKNSFFGGYKKREVIQYMDFVLEENERKVKELEEQVTFLTKENKKLIARVSVKEKNKLEISNNKIEKESNEEHENKPIPFSRLITNSAENQEGLSVRQQMELPEGTYQISEDEVINLPEPQPIYQRKGKNSISNSIEKIEEDSLFQILQEEDVAPYVALTVETQESQSQEQNIYASQKQCLTEDFVKLQDELINVKELLEQEKNNKQILSAKLEYSNELLLQLYKNQPSLGR